MDRIAAMYIHISEWIIRFFLLNMMWVVYSLAGLIIFGIFPATAALFVVLRKIVMKSKDISVVKLFFTSYKKDFIKSNILGYLILFIGIFLYFDIKILNQLGNSLFEQGLLFFLYLITLIYLIVVIYIFPLFVHFDTNIIGYIKNAFVLTIAKPIQTLLMIIGLAMVIFLYRMIPGLIPVFGISVVGFLIMKITSFSLDINDSKE